MAACVETPVPFRAVIDGEFLGTVDSVSVAACKRVCSGCSARDACFEHGIDHVGTAGVYGGLTWQERRTVARKVRARGGYVNVTDRVIRDSTANVPSNKRVASCLVSGAVMEWTFVYDGPVLTANRQRTIQNRHVLAKIVRDIKAFTVLSARAQCPPSRVAAGPVTVEIGDWCKTRNIRDWDAVVPTTKAVLDALQGVVYDNDADIVLAVIHKPQYSPDKTDRIVFKFGWEQ